MKTKNQEKNNDIIKLKREAKSLRSFVFGIISENPEGIYKESFIREMKKSSYEETDASFKSSEQFLNEMKNV